jgi:hypothetical protein
MRLGFLAVPIVVVLALPLSSLAYWRGAGAGSGSASATTLAVPTISGATVGAGTVALSWSAVTPPGEGLLTYYVSRDEGAPGGECPTVASPTTATSCTDSGVSVATHHYTVTAVWHSWKATSESTSVTIAFGAATNLGLTASSPTSAGIAKNLTITARDANGNTVTTYTGSHNLTFAGAGTIGANAPTVTNNTGTLKKFGTATAINFTSGVASVSGSNNGVMKLYKAETASITVSDGTLSNNANPLSVTVSPAAATSLSPAAETKTPVAGAADNLTITALDVYGNTATAYTGSKSLTFAGASAIGSFSPTVADSSGTATAFGTATTIAFTSGVASVTSASNGVMRLYKVETASITVSDGAINSAALSATVHTAALASISPATETNTPVAGTADGLTITALDAYGNGVVGSQNLIFAGAGVAGAFNPTVTNSAGAAKNFGTTTAINFVAGVASVSGSSNGAMTLYKAETASITVSDGAINSSATPLSLTVNAGAAHQLGATAATSSPTAGASFNVTLTVQDTWGNPTNSFTPGSRTVSFSGPATAPNGQLAGYPATVAFNGSGVGTASVTLYDAQTTTVTAADSSDSLNGTTQSLTVGAPATSAARLAWTGVVVSAGVLVQPCLFTCENAGLGNSATFKGKVSVTDLYGNVVSAIGTKHKVKLEKSAGTLSTEALTIATAGAASSTVEFTFTTQAGGSGTDTLTAKTSEGATYTEASAKLGY